METSKKKKRSNGPNTKKWCQIAQSKYNAWRHVTMQANEKDKKAIPPLLNVSYEVVKDWANKTKQRSIRSLCTGAVNAESKELSSQIVSFATTTSQLRQLKMGETNNFIDLSLTVTTTTGATALFSSPTSDKAEREK
jgi:hypothetical protein